MSYELKDGQGSLFKNDKDGVEARPDYTGRINVGGKEFWLSAWIKESAKGKWMSLSLQPKDKQASAAPKRGVQTSSPPPDLSDVPF